MNRVVECTIENFKEKNANLLEVLNKKTDMLIAVIEEKNKQLRDTVEQQERIFKKFLNEDQITALKSETRTPVREWSPESIIKGDFLLSFNSSFIFNSCT